MSSREEGVLNMKITLIPIMAMGWKKSFVEISEMLKKYELLDYIDACYEYFNSTGNQGILDELEEYIKIQGGTVR